MFVKDRELRADCDSSSLAKLVNEAREEITYSRIKSVLKKKLLDWGRKLMVLSHLVF